MYLNNDVLFYQGAKRGLRHPKDQSEEGDEHNKTSVNNFLNCQFYSSSGRWSRNGVTNPRNTPAFRTTETSDNTQIKTASFEQRIRIKKMREMDRQTPITTSRI